jgi:hypothetical protein
LDFELTAQQFTERYSAPSPITGKVPITQKFAFHRTQVAWEGDVPDAFKGDAHAFLVHSIFDCPFDLREDAGIWHQPLRMDNVACFSNSRASTPTTLFLARWENPRRRPQQTDPGHCALTDER